MEPIGTPPPLPTITPTTPYSPHPYYSLPLPLSTPYHPYPLTPLLPYPLQLQIYIDSCLAHAPPKGPDSFVLAYKIFEM